MQDGERFLLWTDVQFQKILFGKEKKKGGEKERKKEKKSVDMKQLSQWSIKPVHACSHSSNCRIGQSKVYKFLWQD